MAHSQILLLKKIDNLGSEGDVVRVRSGYARNFLLPRSLAVPFNLANKKRLDALKIARAAREADELRGAEEMAGKIESLSIAIAVKTGSGGKLFGSVTSQQLVDKLIEEGFLVEKRHLKNFSPIKELGQSKIQLQLHKDIVATFNVEVVSENPIEAE